MSEMASGQLDTEMSIWDQRIVFLHSTSDWISLRRTPQLVYYVNLPRIILFLSLCRCSVLGRIKFVLHLFRLYYMLAYLEAEELVLHLIDDLLKIERSILSRGPTHKHSFLGSQFGSCLFIMIADVWWFLIN